MTFDDLGLSPEVLKAISDAGYTTPTPIQEKAIPYVLMGRDVLGCAQTGTGKTASFTLPMIEILATGRAKARMPRSLILEPTRELAAQVSENFEKYGKYHKLSMALLIGGSSMAEQERVLDRGVDVLIATPGRLLDLFERGKIILADVKILVIDEADRMLDMGFIPDVEKIVSRISKMRQTLFFSATMPPEIKRLADAFLQNPKEVTVSSPTSTASTIEQRVVKIRGKAKEKREALRSLIRSEKPSSALVFCNRKREVGVVYRSLQRHGFVAAELHGDMSQPARTETLARFKAGEVPIMVCSDVAARGLDIPAVSHVFNFDVPTHSEDYIHRIGRTGRAGRAGKSITLAGDEDMRSLAGVTSLIGGKIVEMSLDGTVAGGEPAGASPLGEADSGEEEKPRREGRSRSRGGRSRSRRGGRGEASSESKGEPAAEVPLEASHETPREAPREAAPETAEAPREATELPEEPEVSEQSDILTPAEARAQEQAEKRAQGRSRGRGRGRSRARAQEPDQEAEPQDSASDYEESETAEHETGENETDFEQVYEAADSEAAEFDQTDDDQTDDDQSEDDQSDEEEDQVEDQVEDRDEDEDSAEEPARAARGAEKPEEARRESRGRGRGRGSDRGSDRGGESREARSDRGKGRSRGGRRRHEDELEAEPEAKDGSPFGDQIPAFLLRSSGLPAA